MNAKKRKHDIEIVKVSDNETTSEEDHLYNTGDDLYTSVSATVDSSSQASDDDSDVMITEIEKKVTVEEFSNEESSDEDFGNTCIKQIDPKKSPIKKNTNKAIPVPCCYLHDICDIPIYCKMNRFLTTSEAINIILDPQINEQCICSRLPIGVNCNSTYLVDLGKLANPKDIVCDDMGSWKWGGSYRMWLAIDETGFVKVVGKSKPDCTEADLSYYRIWKRYYDNKSSPDLKKIVVVRKVNRACLNIMNCGHPCIVCLDIQMQTQNIAITQYLFAHDEHEVKVAPHGNSSRTEGYVRTMPSVMNTLKKLSGGNTAKRVVSLATSTAGGVVNAPSAASLPRNRQQVNDLRRGLSKSSDDALYSLMVMCKEGESNMSNDAFVRIVNAAPYPMMVLAYDWMLNDLVRFCANKDNFSVLSVDPTFSLGSFDVTVTTYNHLLLTVKDEACKHPAMIGPLFIHVKKDFPAYHFFASSLVSKCPKLQHLQCFGSDGEAALVNAFSIVFPNALHLRCFLHFRGNIEHKLRELNIPSHFITEIIKDIFGHASCLERGLVDAVDKKELENMLEAVKQKWNDIEQKFSSSCEFHSWFVQHCFDVVLESMSWSVREQAGLGSPPDPFYTNIVESKNNILKQHLQHKKSSLPEFVEAMKVLLQEQLQEIEKAVACSGEYRIVSKYSHLSYCQQKWYKMSAKQRLNKISQFMRYELTGHADASPSSNSDNKDNPLLVLGLPPHLASTIWSRACNLVNEKSAIVSSPGDSLAYIVKSATGVRLHYVKPSKKGEGFICDDQCIGYKASKICSHTVAAALKIGVVPSFVRWYMSLKVRPNFMSLSEHGKPTNSGKKPRKGVSKKVSKKIHDVVLNANEDEFSSRIPVSKESNLVRDLSTPASLGASKDFISASNEHNGSTGSLLSTEHLTRGISPSIPGSSTQFCSHDVMNTEMCISHPTQPVVTVTTSPFSIYNYGVNAMGHYMPVGPHPVLPDASFSMAPYPSYQTSTFTVPTTYGTPFTHTPSHLTQSPLPSVGTPLWVCFVHGNISRCNGCKGKILRDENKKPLPPPHDIIFRHLEQVVFQNPNTGLFQQSRKPRNVYYHPRNTCVVPCFSDFQSDVHIKCAEDVKKVLKTVHLELIMTEFGVNLF